MPRDRVPCPVPGCRRSFHSAARLYFHQREEHPGAEGARIVGAAARDQRRKERDRDAETRERRAAAILDRLYALGCPCGRSKAWHDRQRREIRGAG